ncbi:MAG: thiol:disulfide interchange protein DsbA/DsbL [Gammaproteobacteria bacterium]|nr:thiol:disulfide interchange protein DsbA/DsbL [Gammaproteobacteria bacterium]MYL02448.1 thiol:disulfide interchange protein DsbA/DsbL [Gammaproteobacteria bacterium]
MAVHGTGRFTMRKIPQEMKPKSRNLMLAALFLTAAPLSLAQDAPNWKYQEGVHYDRLVPVQGTSSPPDKIEVAEFFWYGCVFCYRMDAYIEEWKKDQPEEVNFINIPALWNTTMEMHARLYLALQAVDELDAAHRDVFRAIHTENRPLVRLADQERFAERYGVSAEDYRNAFRSFSVESSLRRIMELMRRYRILAVPAFVVNGKYVVRVTPDSDMPQLLEIVDELVARELAER